MSTFKRKQTKQLRKRRHSSSDDQDSDSAEEVGTKIEDLKALQKLRDKQKGVNVVGLALGKKIDKAEEIADQNDPFKMKTGGFVDMKSLKPHQMVTEDGEAIGTAFAAETNRRDEDAEMLRFVEDELAKRRGRALSKKEEEEVSSQEDTLYQLPDRLRLDSAKRSEDMLSNQMLSGIPEIDLGIHAKIKNIEATEDAKQKLLRERMRKKDSEVSDFVPTNMAVNFVQHNRFTIEDTAPSQKQVKVEVAPPKPVRVGDADDAEPPPENPSRSGKSTKDKNSGEKATDDFHYEKFKKQMRRY